MAVRYLCFKRVKKKKGSKLKWRKVKCSREVKQRLAKLK